MLSVLQLVFWPATIYVRIFDTVSVLYNVYIYIYLSRKGIELPAARL